MKKLFYFIFLFIFSSSSVIAQDFSIQKFTADIYINEAGYFDVVEKYDINFDFEKHGIYRDIITKFNYKDENGIVENRRIYISNIEVPGNKFEVSKGKDFYGNLVQIKIGDKDKKIIGPKHYEIRYRVTNALFFTDSLVLFYWNVKPSEWRANFEQIDFNIHVPKGIELNARNCFTYAGIMGDSTVSNLFSYSFENNTYSAESKEFFYSISDESVTALVKMPKANVSPPNTTSLKIRDKGWMGILGAFVFWVWMMRRKYKSQKVTAVTSYYPPKGIDSPTAGHLIDDVIGQSDLISLLPKWGYDGLIRMEVIQEPIKTSKQNIKIIKLKELPNDAPIYEKILFKGLFSDYKEMGELFKTELKTFFRNPEDINKQLIDLFEKHEFKQINEVKTEDLKDNFNDVINIAYNALKQESKKYYNQEDMGKIATISIVGFVLWIGMIGLFTIFFNPLAAVVGGILGLVSLFMVFTIQKKNEKGNAVLEELKGYKQFIKMADLNRIKALTKEDPNYFEKTMSYALAFGLLEKWAEKFEALGFSEPKWFSGGNIGNLGNSGGFAKTFSSSMYAVQSSMVSAPVGSSSSGGGSAGGGAGGGGGGSW